MSEQKIKVFTEWTRSEPIDRSKRVAPGAELSTKNILKNTRTRKDVNYSEASQISMNPQRSNVRKNAKNQSKNVLEVRNKNMITALTNATKGLTLKSADTEKPRRKKTATKKVDVENADVEQTTEKQDQEEQEDSVEEQEEETEEAGEDIYNKFKSGEEFDDEEEDGEFEAEGEEEEDNQLNNSAFMTDDAEAVEQLTEEAKTWEKDNKQSAKPKDTSRRVSDQRLAPSIVKALTKLGCKVPETFAQGKYKQNSYNIPAPIQQLGSTNFNGQRFKSEKFDLGELEFVITDIQEWDECKFLASNEDAIIIGEGNALLVAKQEPGVNVNFADPKVYIVTEASEDAEEEVEGPIALSAIIATLEVDESEEGSEAEENDE